MQDEHDLDSFYAAMSGDELKALFRAFDDIKNEAVINAHKRPKATTLIEEVAELVLSFRGKHRHSPELELIQAGSVCVNLLWQMRVGARVNNLSTYPPANSPPSRERMAEQLVEAKDIGQFMSDGATENGQLRQAARYFLGSSEEWPWLALTEPALDSMSLDERLSWAAAFLRAEMADLEEAERRVMKQLQEELK